ncbi:MAG: rhodanese-like domain-containing protein [Planctomycetota bacterium]
MPTFTTLLPRRIPAPAATVLALAAAATIAGCPPNVSERDIAAATIQAVRDAASAPVSTATDRPHTLIDARVPSAFKQGHLQGAINLNIADITPGEPRRPDLAAAKSLIVYGQNPGDPLARGLALRLLEAGYKETRLFPGGVDAWTRAGGELQTAE